MVGLPGARDAGADPGRHSAAEYMKGKKTFEVNPKHPVILGLARRVDASKNEFDADGKKAVELLYDAALVTSGFTVESPREFASRIFDMIGLAVGEGGEVKREEAAAARAAVRRRRRRSRSSGGFFFSENFSSLVFFFFLFFFCPVFFA